MSTNRLGSVFEFRRTMATSRRQRLGVLLAIAGLSFAFALFLGLFVGAWMVIPFAGLEVGCVALAFWWVERSSSDRDLVEISESSVEIKRIRSGRAESHSFTRAWVQLDIERDATGREKALRLRQSGKSVSLAEFLRANEQREAAKTLRAALSQPAWA